MAAGENVMNEETVNAAIAVLKGMHEDQAVPDDRRVDDGMNGRVGTPHSRVRGDHAFHQRGEVTRLGGDEMDALALPRDRFTDVVLVRPVVLVAEALVNRTVLEVDQRLFLKEVIPLGELEERDEALGAIGAGFDVFDLEGRLRFLRVEVCERAFQKLVRIALDDFPAPLGEVGALKRREPPGPPDDGTEIGVAQEVVADPLAGDRAPGRGVVFVGLEKIDVVSDGDVSNRQSLTGQQFVQVPDAACVFPVRLGADVCSNVVLRGDGEELGEDKQVGAVVLEGKLQVIAKRVAWPILCGVNLLDQTAGQLDPASASGRDCGRVPVGDDGKTILVDELEVTGWFGGVSVHTDVKQLCYWIFTYKSMSVKKISYDKGL